MPRQPPSCSWTRSIPMEWRSSTTSGSVALPRLCPMQPFSDRLQLATRGNPVHAAGNQRRSLRIVLATASVERQCRNCGSCRVVPGHRSGRTPSASAAHSPQNRCGQPALKKFVRQDTNRLSVAGGADFFEFLGRSRQWRRRRHLRAGDPADWTGTFADGTVHPGRAGWRVRYEGRHTACGEGVDLLAGRTNRQVGRRCGERSSQRGRTNDCECAHRNNPDYRSS